MAWKASGVAVRRWFETAFVAVARSMASVVGAAVFRFRLYGWHRFPASGGVILASNHQSFLDPPLLGATSPRPVRFLARKTLFVGLWGAFLRGLGAIPMDRENPDLAGLKEAIGALHEGGILMVFPEGTRTRDGKLGVFRPGVSMLARRGEAVVVPCIVRGAYEAWSRRSPLPTPFRPVRVHYGEPVVQKEGEGPRDLAERVERAMRDLWAATERPGGSSR